MCSGVGRPDVPRASERLDECLRALVTMLGGESLDLLGLLPYGLPWHHVECAICGSTLPRRYGPVGFYPLSSPIAAAWATASRREDTASLR